MRTSPLLHPRGVTTVSDGCGIASSPRAKNDRFGGRAAPPHSSCRCGVRGGVSTAEPTREIQQYFKSCGRGVLFFSEATRNHKAKFRGYCCTGLLLCCERAACHAKNSDDCNAPSKSTAVNVIVADMVATPELLTPRGQDSVLWRSRMILQKRRFAARWSESNEHQRVLQRRHLLRLPYLNYPPTCAGSLELKPRQIQFWKSVQSVRKFKVSSAT